MLTAVELARGARMAANRAYLAALGLGPKAIATGAVAAVPPSHAFTLEAARKLARAAAIAQATNQVRDCKLFQNINLPRPFRRYRIAPLL